MGTLAETIRRFSLSVGFSSPDETENCTGSTRNFLIVSYCASCPLTLSIARPTWATNDGSLARSGRSGTIRTAARRERPEIRHHLFRPGGPHDRDDVAALPS